MGACSGGGGGGVWGGCVGLWCVVGGVWGHVPPPPPTPRENFGFNFYDMAFYCNLKAITQTTLKRNCGETEIRLSVSCIIMYYQHWFLLQAI